MAIRSRRSVSSFNLSFLDIMFCGFGAVVLLVLLIDTNVITNRLEAVEDRRLEFMKEELRTAQLREQNQQQERQSETLDSELNVLEDKVAVLATDNDTLKRAQSSMDTVAQLEAEIERLKESLTRRAAEVRQLEARQAEQRLAGQEVRPFIGQGDRQYLTGLKLGGKRVVILIDSSASMLERKIVDIVRLKVLDENKRRSAPKWQRTIETVEWLLAKLPASCSVQLYHFNSTTTSLAGDPAGQWIAISDKPAVDAMVNGLKSIAPSEGTNLEAAFSRVKTLLPQPDNIILLTDGLPTRDKRVSSKKTISGKERVRLFEKARKQLPAGVPVNIILFPVEGDPLASLLYWQLALESQGSFLTPAKDWP